MPNPIDDNGRAYPKVPPVGTLTVTQSCGGACVLCSGISGRFTTMLDVWGSEAYEAMYRYPEQYVVHRNLDECAPSGTLVVQVVQYDNGRAVSGKPVNYTVDEYKELIESQGGEWTTENSYAVRHMAAEVHHDEHRYTSYWAD